MMLLLLPLLRLFLFGGTGLLLLTFVMDFKFGLVLFFFATFPFCGDFNDIKIGDFATETVRLLRSFFLCFLSGLPKVWPEKVSYRVDMKSMCVVIFEFMKKRKGWIFTKMETSESEEYALESTLTTIALLLSLFYYCD